MPGGGADIRQVQMAAAMKSFGKQWKPSKIEKHMGNIADLNIGQWLEQIGFVNSLRGQILYYLDKHWKMLIDQNRALIIKMIRGIEKYCFIAGKGGPINLVFPHIACNCSPSPYTISKSSPGPPQNNKSLASIFDHLIAFLNHIFSPVNFIKKQKDLYSWYAQDIAMYQKQEYKSGLENEVYKSNFLVKGLAALTAGIAAMSINVAKPDYKSIDNVVEPAGITLQVGAKEAKAGEYIQKISSQELYDMATQVNDSRLPDGLRVIQFYERGFDADKTIIFNSDEDKSTVSWKKIGEFSSDYFGQRYGSQLKNILQEYGVDLLKLENLMRLIGTERKVMVFNNGKLSFADGNNQKLYLLTTNPGIKKAIEKIYFAR
jgi:hypothetical protein